MKLDCRKRDTRKVAFHISRRAALNSGLGSLPILDYPDAVVGNDVVKRFPALVVVVVVACRSSGHDGVLKPVEVSSATRAHET